MDATGLLVTFSGAQLVALLIFAFRVGGKVQSTADMLAQHEKRLDGVEPKMDRIDARLNELKGRGCFGRREYDKNF